MIRNLLLACFASLLLFFMYAPFDSSVREWTQRFFISLMSNEHGTMSTQACSGLSLLYPGAIFEKLEVSHADDWSMKCNQCTLRFSWWKLFATGALHLSLQLNQVDVTTNVYEEKLACMDYLASLLSSKKPLPIPVIIDSVSIQPWALKVTHTHGTASLMGSMQAKLLRDSFKLQSHVHQGSISYAGIKAKDCIGSVRFEQNAQGALTIQPDLQLKLIPTNLITHVSGIWTDDHGRFRISSLDDTLLIDPIILTSKQKKLGLRTQGHLPLQLISHPYATLDGLVSLFAQANITDGISECYLSTQEATLNDNPLTVTMRIKQKKDRWHSLVQGAYKGNGIETSFDWHTRKSKGRFDLTNTTPITLFGQWYLEPRSWLVSCDVADNTLQGNWQVNCSSSYQQQEITGSFSVLDKQATCSLAAGPYHALVTATKDLPYINCASVLYDDTPLLSVEKEEGKLHLYADVHHGLTLAKLFFDTLIQADGKIDALITPHAHGCEGHVSFHGAARVPYNSNLIRFLETDIAWMHDKKLCELSHMIIKLYQGTMRMEQGTFNYQHNWVYAPILLDRCVLSAHKDLCASVSGYTLISESLSSPLVSGYLLIDKAFIKNMSALQTTPSVHMPDYRLDLKLCSGDPITFDIPRFTGSASLDIHLKHMDDNYGADGVLKLLQGKVHFPYKDLLLVRGQYLFTGNPLNPTVNVQARSMVRKHMVNMYVNGLFDQQQVLFDASPPLTEEQIIALLWTGSPEESLNALVPALVTQNIKELMFTNEALTHLFPGMKKFHFNVIPRFSDQTGRGGLRAALEIEVNERWRASIQQNFSLTEDTRFELEYLLSDDITVRAIRDERRDVGGEVEMRFKF